MLGFLIDELLSKNAVPNGMGFWYRYTKAVLAALVDKVPNLRHRFAEVEGNEDRLAAEVARLVEDWGRKMRTWFSLRRTRYGVGCFFWSSGRVSMAARRRSPRNREAASSST